MTEPSDVPLQILLMATVARLRRKPPASTKIITTVIDEPQVVGSVQTIGGELTVIKGRHEGRPMALVAIDAYDAYRVAQGTPVTIWDGGEIMGRGYGLVTPTAMAA